MMGLQSSVSSVELLAGSKIVPHTETICSLSVAKSVRPPTTSTNNLDAVVPLMPGCSMSQPPFPSPPMNETRHPLSKTPQRTPLCAVEGTEATGQAPLGLLALPVLLGFPASIFQGGPMNSG